MTSPQTSASSVEPRRRERGEKLFSATSASLRFAFLAVLMPLVVSVLFAQHDVDSPNVASRMDTIQSLVERRTFCIDQSLGKFRVDVIKIGDHFYSDKPPLLSVLGAGLYWPLHTILGMSFANKAHEPWLYHILTVVFVGLTAAIGLWLLAQCLFLAGLESSAIARTVILTGAGTMFLPYAVTFNNHVPAAMAITGALYCFLRAQSNGASAARWLALAGLFAGLAFNLDVVPGAVALVGFAALAFQRKRRLADVAAYGIGLIGPMLVFFFLNWLVTGGIKPAYMCAQYYDYPGSILRSYDALKRPYENIFPVPIIKSALGRLGDQGVWLHVGVLAGRCSEIFHMLFGYRGIFSYSPILLFGLWEVIRQLRGKGKYRWHGVVALATVIVPSVVYTAQTGGMAGGSYAMRWLLPATPLFAFFMGLAEPAMVALRIRRLFAVAAAFSIAVAAVGVPRPWCSNIRSPVTFLDNVAYFAQTVWPPAKPPAYWIVEATSLEKGYAYLEIGRWHMNNGYYKAAIPDLERARLLDPNRANLADYYLGICYDASGSPDLALPVYERLLAREPDNTGVWNNYARSLLKLGMTSSAVTAFRKSLEIDPKKTSTLLGLGQAYLTMGKPDEAVRHWEKALEIDPNQPDLHAQLADLYRQAGNMAKAIEHMRELERLRPDDEAVRRAIAELNIPASTTPALTLEP